MSASSSSGSIAFNQLHGECQTRIQQKRWCPQCNREVPNSEIVKGYQFEKGRYVVLSQEDFDKVRPESTRVIDLVQFTDESAIDPIYVDRTYYLAPDGKIAADAFAVMREGMKGKVGIGKLALHLAHKAEHAVDLETGAIVGLTVQDADDGDTTTSRETLTRHRSRRS